MDRTFLECLYWACTDESADPPGPADLYERMEDAGKADHLFSEALYATNLTVPEKNHIENLDCTALVAHEKQGFINGFRLGMKLAGEVNMGGLPK